MKEIYKTLQKKFGSRILFDVPLAPYTTYKIGGPADIFFEAKTTDEIVSVITEARALHIPYVLLGGGTNVLVSDTGFRGLVIKNNAANITIKAIKGIYKGQKKDGIVFLEVDAGVSMNRLVRFTIDEGLSGLEMHLGLPGSVGGAIVMNSKWMNPPGFVGDVLAKATILTKDGQVKVVEKGYFQFAYGFSILQKNEEILLSVVLSLHQGQKEQLWHIADESILHRRKTQPQGVSTAGCVFKNISSADALVAATPNHATSAGFLIDKAGLKGVRIGGAEISSVHANFIVNTGNATASDVVQLIDLCKKRVKEAFGVELQEEIKRIGDF